LFVAANPASATSNQERKMLDQIQGLHHVTAMASDARENNVFFTKTLGLRRVKKTVNFDAPDVYHLYYGNGDGLPGSIMTYFPFPNIVKGLAGTGEVGTTAFSVPKDSLEFWERRFADQNVSGVRREERFGEMRLAFGGPDGDGLVLIEHEHDSRQPWLHAGLPRDEAICGFHSVSLRLKDAGPTEDLLRFMGYELVETIANVKRLAIPNGNGADVVDLETLPSVDSGRQGAGSVHHVAFAAESREKQLDVRKALIDAGFQVTPVIDRDYFWSVYFRAPGGVLFEIATNEPGFARDEEPAHLGEGLMIPKQHAHLRPRIEQILQPIED
jgi:glyoxalase family protein